MTDLPRLIDAICEAYDQGWYANLAGQRPPFQPIPDNPATPENERATFCNLAVHYVAERMGYAGFAGLLANQMIDVMLGKGWEKIEMAQAQPLANQGGLVIAGQHDQPHGHVCVVRPGEMEMSGKWGVMCPKVMNIGAKNIIARPVSYVFKDPPDFFTWGGVV